MFIHSAFSIQNRVVAIRISLLLQLFLYSRAGRCQVYNYDPIRHSNFETNPAYLASDKIVYSANLVEHAALFSSGGFYNSALKFSAYSQKYFTGFGLVLSRTRINDSTDYSYAGIGIGYRTVLFNKVYVKIGLLYKTVNVKSSPGNFTYYSFAADTAETGLSENRRTQNANVSVSFSSPGDKYYVSGALLNYNLPWVPRLNRNFFPQYYVLNIGDFGKLMDSRIWEIYYTGFTKKYYGQKNLSYSNFITVLWALPVTRSSKFKMGARIGAVDNLYVQINPVFSFYKMFSRRKSIACGFLFDSGYFIKTNKTVFPAGAQFNLNFTF